MPLTKKIYTDFYMNEVERSGITVEYWDITTLYFKNFHLMEDSSHLTKVRKFFTFNKIEKAIISEEKLSKVLFISIMTFEGRVKALYLLLSKYNCNLAVFGRNMFPMPSAPRNLSNFFKKFNISTILNYFETRQLLRLVNEGRIKKYDVVFLGGACGWQGIGRVSLDDIKNSIQIKVNSDDYDNYLSLKGYGSSSEDRYILFLDEYLPLHPDTTLFKIKNVKVQDYYPELNSYFDRVEKQFNLPVVIAAHPKAVRYRTEDFFNGRKVVFHKTAELTKDAYFVLAHDSTSINFPIAFGKKIHFITSRSISRGINSVHRNIVHFAENLGSNYQFMDNVEEKVNLIPEIAKAKYDQYKFNFQTSIETENKFSREIFIDFLTKV